MADPASPQPQNAPAFQIQRVYLKDASLEMPNAPSILLEQDAPSVEVQIDAQAESLGSDMYEVTVTATVTAKIKDRTLFLVEGKQAGIFQIANVPADQIEPVLGIMCPSIVYPYLRASVADLVTRTGLPAITLTEINWEAFYQQRLAAAAQRGSAAAAAPLQ